ncbi:hypothetical protein [Curtobacterium sp. RRHDQ10]|uniref:hypothetical protein n=1 Tax=Curtobacterium phyllosphaerae TaxID=3413379 RepID=UPI003BF37578
MVRWVILGVWAALLVVRVSLGTWDPHTNLTLLGSVQVASVVVGVLVVVAGLRQSWVARRRRVDEALGAAVRRFDPTVRLVPAVPTDELRASVAAEHAEIVLPTSVMWGFGATEASLWQLDGNRATRVLVIGWDRVVHVALEAPDDTGSRGGRAAVVAIHYIGPDDNGAVASFLVRRGLGSPRVLGRERRVEQLVRDLTAERITL